MLASMSRMAAISLFTPWFRSCAALASSSPSCRMSPYERAAPWWQWQGQHRCQISTRLVPAAAPGAGTPWGNGAPKSQRALTCKLKFGNRERKKRDKVLSLEGWLVLEDTRGTMVKVQLSL